ncbi:MAG: hypothetical protein VB050_18025 [Geobacteraceae bacterium]|nr:hypothetical protein [Geobacteraceae bacterium]
MPRSCCNSMICLLLVLIPATVSAKSDRNAEAIVTLRNGQPCFSYPKDKDIRKWHYSFGSLDVSETGPNAGKGVWQVGLSDPYRKKGLLEPNSVGTCVKYGVLNPGMEVTQPAEPLQFNTPYRVHISVLKSDQEGGNVRLYASDFCLSRNAKGEKIIVGAVWDDKTDAPRCSKPGESPKCSLWQRLIRFLSR